MLHAYADVLVVFRFPSPRRVNRRGEKRSDAETLANFSVLRLVSCVLCLVLLLWVWFLCLFLLLFRKHALDGRHEVSPCLFPDHKPENGKSADSCDRY